MATPEVSRTPVTLPDQALRFQPGRPGVAALLLLLGALAALVVGYSSRPQVTIDVGAAHDTLHITGVHAREFTPVAPVQRFAWPADAATLDVPGPLNPAFAALTLTLDDWEPDDRFSRRLIAVYVGERRIDTLSDRGGGRDFRVLLPADLPLASGLTVRAEAIPDRTLDVPPLRVVAATLSGARTYRWTDGAATVRLPALGRGAWRVDLHAVVAHPDGRPVDAVVRANGVTLATLPEYADVRRVSLLVPAALVGGGDLELELASQTYSDPRPLGVLLERVTVAPLAGSATPLPPWGALGSGLVVLLCLYGALRVERVPAWLALAAGVAVAALGSWALAEHRYPTGFFLEPLALLMLFSLALAPLADRLAAWGFARAGVPLSPWLRRALVVMFLAGLWLKGGGLLFPTARGIDVSWHMDRVRWILDGHLAEMYRPGAFSESVMPIDEWGENRPVIPYSPFFHLFSTVFALFPWPLETSANIFSVLLDTSRVFLVALLARKAGLSERATLLAALLLAVTPVTFLLHSWGNIPTTSGMWLTLLTTTAMVALYPRLHERGPFVLLTALTLVTLLFYTVMAVFHGLFVLAFLALALVIPNGLDRRPLRPIALSLVLATLLSLLIYYGQYIPSMVERTLPYMLSLTTQGSQSVGVERMPFGEYMLSFWPHLRYDMRPDGFLYYGLLLPLIFVLPGFAALRRSPLMWVTLSAWFSVAVLFMFAGYRMSMVDKQLFYIVPAICLCWAVWAERLWRRGWWGRLLIATVYLFTLVSAIDLWVIRIIRSPIA